MYEGVIPLVSLTQAYQAQEILNQYRIPSSIIPTPHSLTRKGCGYSLKVGHNPEMVRRILRQEGLLKTE